LKFEQTDRYLTLLLHASILRFRITSKVFPTDYRMDGRFDCETQSYHQLEYRRLLRFMVLLGTSGIKVPVVLLDVLSILKYLH